MERYKDKVRLDLEVVYISEATEQGRQEERWKVMDIPRSTGLQTICTHLKVIIVNLSSVLIS